MNFRDQFADDLDGKKFVFTVEMQRALLDAGQSVTVEAFLAWRENFRPPSAPNPNSRRDSRGGGRSSRPNVNVPDEIQLDPATGKFIGVLKNYNKEKGFGFIFRGGGEEIYFNKKKTLDNPSYFSIGQKVLYDENEFRGKMEAINVEEYEESME